jgi:prepilin-type N-terminal cleavage/methylation domain-containing protein
MLRKGFTLIELLIVIAILGILAVSVLSAINPVEQMKKARDTGRKSDSAELLNAHERYFTTFGCYSWANGAIGCGTLALGTAIATSDTFAAGYGVANFNGDLITKEELKSQFSSRSTIAKSELYVTESIIGQVSICFVPESKSARAGGLGPNRNNTNTGAATGCAGAYSKTDTTCSVCVPQ